jgi:uncharacterized 2Fe-2S/4Fe-4S cluster protein (DUF4445 family)
MCGSGVLDAVAVGLSLRHIAVDGRLRRGRNRLEVGGPDVFLSQADLREVQLAKGAIAAAIRLLLAEWKARAAHLDAMFITGKFGAALSLTSAEAIGLLPQAPGAVVRQHSNLALKGAVRATLEPEQMKEADRLAASCTEVVLSGHPGFEEAFVSSMRFEPWS